MPLSNFGVVVPGKLYRCGQPDPRGFADLRLLGVRRVLKLDAEGEYPLTREVGEFAIIETGQGPLVVIPIDIGYPVVSIRSLTIAADTVQASLDLGEPLAVHCKKGRDRTGAVIAAWRIRGGHWTLEQAMMERLEFGTDWLLDRTFDRGVVEALEEIARG